MNAVELYEIVKDADRAAWPAGLGYSECGFSEPVWISPCSIDESVGFHEPDLAEAAFVGSMVAWLYANDKSVPGKAGNTYIVISEPYGVREYPTLIEALAAACKEARP